MIQVMTRLEEYGFHINSNKIQYKKREVEFLGFNLRSNTISLDSFIARQQQKLPRVTGRRELQVALGIVNVLRSFVPNLSSKLAPYYDVLKDTTRRVNWTIVEEQFDRTWAEIMSESLALCWESKNIRNAHYTLCSDWSGEGTGFALYKDDQLVWIGSRKNRFWRRKVSSFLGEVDAIVWALKESLWLIRGSVVTVLTDSDSGQQRLNRPETWIKETDGRVLRLLGWLLGNFAIGSQLTFAFIPCKDNMIVDQLSRWRHYKIMKNDPEDIAEFEMVNEDMKEIDTSTNEQRNDQDLRAVKLTDTMWNIGHHGHYGVKKTWLRLETIWIPSRI